MRSRVYWSAPLPDLGFTDGPSVTAAALTDASPTATPVILEPDDLAQGSTLRINAFGNISSSSTPTITVGFYYGGTGGVALAVSGLQTLSASFASWPWILEWEGEVRQLGSSGQIVGQGKLWWPTSLTAFAAQPLPITAALRTVTVDTTTRKQLSVGCTLSATTGTFVCNHLRAELLG